jgi:hypothetical protein
MTAIIILLSFISLGVLFINFWLIGILGTMAQRDKKTYPHFVRPGYES